MKWRLRSFDVRAFWLRDPQRSEVTIAPVSRTFSAALAHARGRGTKKKK
jgi:hypothetical protein